MYVLVRVDLISLLTPETVTELVIESMKNVPSMQPKMFGHSYTPIAAAGTVAQVGTQVTSGWMWHYVRTTYMHCIYTQQKFSLFIKKMLDC